MFLLHVIAMAASLWSWSCGHSDGHRGHGHRGHGIVVIVVWSCYRGHCAGGASGTRTRTRARARARAGGYRIASPHDDGAGNSTDTFVFFFESHPLAFRSITGCEIQRYHGNMKELT